MENINKKVKELLSTEYDFDFDSDWWGDEEKVIFDEIVEATIKVINRETNENNERN